jgi:hypothetical protein
MLKKLITISILAVSLSLNISGAKADTFMNWNVGVDIPVRYTPAITAGENGIILKGEQSNANKLGFNMNLSKKTTGPMSHFIKSSSRTKAHSAGPSTYHQGNIKLK